MEAAHNILVVSDLHLSEGLHPDTGQVSHLEDFLFDGAFARFLQYHEDAKHQPRFGGQPWLLIINGDQFDFLQVVSMPAEGVELHALKNVTNYRQLRTNERKYGLGTTAEESAWRLERIARGHQRFFAALGWFVAQGNRVVVIKGNHDVELHWSIVQDRFVEQVERAYRRQRLMLGQGEPISLEGLRSGIEFYPWYYYEAERIYVEHGGQYDGANRFRDFLNPVLVDDPSRIELPGGSLFVRYLFNRLEDVHPFADNIKPISRYLAWAIKKDAVTAVEVLASRGWVFLRAFWNIGRKILASSRHQPALSVRAPEHRSAPSPLPLRVTSRVEEVARLRAAASWQEWAEAATWGLLTSLLGLSVVLFAGLVGLSVVGQAGRSTFGYLVATVAAYLLRRSSRRSLDALFEAHKLERVAGEVVKALGPQHRVRYIVLGHNHKAGLKQLGETWYINTGAWVPLYTRNGPIEGREKLTFFRLAWTHRGTPELLCWDNSAGAPTDFT